MRSVTKPTHKYHGVLTRKPTTDHGWCHRQYERWSDFQSDNCRSWDRPENIHHNVDEYSRSEEKCVIRITISEFVCERSTASLRCFSLQNMYYSWIITKPRGGSSMWGVSVASFGLRMSTSVVEIITETFSLRICVQKIKIICISLIWESTSYLDSKFDVIRFKMEIINYKLDSVNFKLDVLLAKLDASWNWNHYIMRGMYCVHNKRRTNQSKCNITNTICWYETGMLWWPVMMHMIHTSELKNQLRENKPARIRISCADDT